MRVFGFDISRTTGRGGLRSAALPVRGSRGWFPIIREPSSGAWQRNEELAVDSALAYFAVFACTTLIAQDIGKIRLRLVSQDEYGIWTETTSPAFSPVLRRPNRFQTTNKFVEQWQVSKLLNGNTYALKQRDERNVVRALYILDPLRVAPLVTPSGDVYYELRRDDLSAVPEPPDGLPIIVPASEVIHDLMVALFHPLIGVGPIYACGIAALQGLTIQRSSSRFFGNGSNPGGVLTAPGAIADDTATRLKEYWESNFSGENAGKVAVLGDGLKYEAMALSAAESQLIEQLKFSAETVCSCYHVPPYMIQVGPPPPYANVEPLVQQYYSQCLQSLITGMETALDFGLELPTGYGTEFDIDDLSWMDTATRTDAASKSIGAGALSPNEARKKYFGVGPVPGGDTPYLQQQMYSLEALAERDADQPFSKSVPGPVAAAPDDPTDPTAENPDDLSLETIEKAFSAKNWSAMYASG
jgi:HK97 family phage portal protein